MDVVRRQWEAVRAVSRSRGRRAARIGVHCVRARSCIRLQQPLLPVAAFGSKRP